MLLPSHVIRARVARIEPGAVDIKVFDLVDERGQLLPPFTAGAHISVFLSGLGTRHYSLCGPLADRSRYRIAVLRQERGRGGSKHMHDRVRAGDVLEISPPVNHFPLVVGARYLMLAGGIGVTPILPMIEELRAKGRGYRLYYCAKSAEHAAFREALREPEFADTIVFHFDGGDLARSLDVSALLDTQAPGTHVYCCGPTGLMDAVREATASWPRDLVHFEYFQTPAAGRAPDDLGFEVLLSRSGRRVQVPPHVSIVQALREEGIAVETSCEAGVCGTCRTRYLGGSPVHADSLLNEDERQYFVMLCCSRARGLLVLDL